jgi:hypothetical protein
VRSSWIPWAFFVRGSRIVTRSIIGLSAIPFGVVVEIGQVDRHRLPLLTDIVRAPSATASEMELIDTLIAHVAQTLPHDATSVSDRGFSLAKIITAGVARFVARVPVNFTARRATPPPYAGRGRHPTRGDLVRPLARQYKGKKLAASPPDRTEEFLYAGRHVRADIWSNVCCAAPALRHVVFQCVAFHDPAFTTPLVTVSNLPLTPNELASFYTERWPNQYVPPTPPPVTTPTLAAVYRDRWPVEQIPQTAKQLLGAHRQFVFAPEARQRLPELALVAGNVLMYLAATQPAQPTGFWDRAPRPTAGRLRRVLNRLTFSESWPLPEQLRKKDSRTDHLPKGISAHRRAAQPVPAQI